MSICMSHVEVGTDTGLESNIFKFSDKFIPSEKETLTSDCFKGIIISPNKSKFKML